MPYRSALAHVLHSTVEPTAELARTRGAFPRASVAALAETGLLGLLTSVHLGGRGLGLAEAGEVVSEVSRACPATGAVLRSHYAAVAFIEAYGAPWLRREVASGEHLSTLALDNVGGDGASTAVVTGDVVALRARKRDVVAAGEADSYVWSSESGDDLALWLVPADAWGLYVPARPGGAGPRGSATSTVCADPVRIPASTRLGQPARDIRDTGRRDALIADVRAWLASLPAAEPVMEPAAEPVGADAFI